MTDMIPLEGDDVERFRKLNAERNKFFDPNTGNDYFLKVLEEQGYYPYPPDTKFVKAGYKLNPEKTKWQPKGIYLDVTYEYTDFIDKKLIENHMFLCVQEDGTFVGLF